MAAQACRCTSRKTTAKVGPASLSMLADCVKAVRGVSFMKEFGAPVATCELEVENFPAVVTRDAHGRSLPREVRAAGDSPQNRARNRGRFRDADNGGENSYHAPSSGLIPSSAFFSHLADSLLGNRDGNKASQ